MTKKAMQVASVILMVPSGRIENCYHVGQVSGADVNNNICNLNIGQIENSYYDCNICDKDAITRKRIVCGCEKRRKQNNETICQR